MKVSLIITTYNWKEALEVVLISALKQTILPREIIVADDGSALDTNKVIKNYNATSTIPIIHSWQPDKGFRAAMSRNKAIAKAKSDYIIIVDGDMVLHERFIEDHIGHAQTGFFMQGSRVLVNQHLSEQLLKDKKMQMSFFTKGIENRKNSLRLPIFSRLLSYPNKSLGSVRSCNMAFWREDVIAVNGFNEDFVGWGREDSECVVRLFNNNLKRRNIKFMAIAYHLYHPENSRQSLPQNDAILENTIAKRRKWCENGIDKYL